MLTESYRAATERTAIAEEDRCGIVKLTGSERVSWLQGMVTNDVQKLSPGNGCYAAHLTPQGKIVAHMHILADEDVLWLSLERAAIPKLIQAFDKLLIMEDVQTADVSDEYSILGLIGPQSLALLKSWAGQPLDLHTRYSHHTLDNCRIVSSDLGYDIWVPRAETDAIVRSLTQTGATAIDRGT